MTTFSSMNEPFLFYPFLSNFNGLSPFSIYLKIYCHTAGNFISLRPFKALFGFRLLDCLCKGIQVYDKGYC